MPSLGETEPDLEQLSRRLVERDLSLDGYVLGMTSIRDAVAELESCSLERAEELVEILQGRGFVRFEGDPARVSGWPQRWVVEVVPHPVR